MKKMEHSKNVPYLGGLLKFVPAGSGIDKENGREFTYEARVKVFDGSHDDVVLSIEAVRAIYTAIRTDTDLQAFIGV